MQIAGMIKKDYIIEELKATTKRAVLAELSEILSRDAEGLPPGAMVEVLLEREKLGSTGIGDGIAIPHPRNPIVLHVDHPLVTLCFLRRPVDFSALDGKPVVALFSLISSTPKMHLHLLSRLAYVLRDPGCKAAIARRADAAAILDEVRRVESGLGT